MHELAVTGSGSRSVASLLSGGCLLLLLLGAALSTAGDDADGSSLRDAVTNSNSVENNNNGKFNQSADVRLRVDAAAVDCVVLDSLVTVLLNYSLRLRNGQAGDVCSSFRRIDEQFSAAIDDHVSVEPCKQTAPTFEHVRSILRTLRCACVEKTESCERSVECFEREASGLLYEQCDERLAFNVHQNTQPVCYFVQEAANCKMALVTSSCGVNEAGELAYHVTALQSTSANSSRLFRFRGDGGGVTSHFAVSCDVTRLNLDTYTGFRYDANCPSYFVEDMEMCAARHVYGSHLKFDADNDLIASAADPDDIAIACRAFRDYKLCIRPIKKACPRGVQAVYDGQTPLRLYRLKMDFICSKTNRQEYRRYLPCYQTVMAGRMTSHVMRACELLWQQRLKPALRHVTAHRFYCDAQAPKTLAISRLVVQLRRCYEDAFGPTCKPEAGRLFGRLVDVAFTDPHYPRYRYRPDCQLHRRLPHDADTAAAATVSPQHDSATATTDASLRVVNTTSSPGLQQQQQQQQWALRRPMSTVQLSVTSSAAAVRWRYVRRCWSELYFLVAVLILVTNFIAG